MLRKILVIWRVIVFVGIICFFVYGYFSLDLGLFIASLWLTPLMFAILLGLTAWIETIDTRLRPLSHTDIKKRNIKAVISLIVVAVLAGISLLFV